MQSGLDVRPLTSVEVYAHLADFGVNMELADGKIKRMSGGQKSRLVLAARPSVILPVCSYEKVPQTTDT
jgi:elongation factor 3